jgi:hypothetical protein
MAKSEGYIRGADPTIGTDDNFKGSDYELVPLPDMLKIYGSPLIRTEPSLNEAGYPDEQGEANPYDPTTNVEEAQIPVPEVEQVHSEQRPEEHDSEPTEQIDVSISDEVTPVRRSMRERRMPSHLDNYAFKISVRSALKSRRDEAETVIAAELQQLLDKKVWHGVHASDLTHHERSHVIRSSMFLKDKYNPSGGFDKFKARLVAGGDGQDKSLYECLSSPTVATSSVMIVAAIAAKEGRRVRTMDIGGAFLNADMAPTGVVVHMKLDRLMTGMIVKLDPSFTTFVSHDGTSLVALDKALYGCVEAANLWYNNLRSTFLSYGFTENLVDPCVFNKMMDSLVQLSVTTHVDDLLCTCINEQDLDDFEMYLKDTYREIKSYSGEVVDYIGMTFNFKVRGEVSITMNSCVRDIIEGSGVTISRKTPATDNLFEIRESEKLHETEKKWFHTYVAKMLYLAKRVRPECLTAVSFLSTRVQECDVDDMAKLKRLLGYIRGSSERGITLRIGKVICVRQYIDASYGVHTSSGRSHTGCIIMVGEGGAIYAKSSKQKIVTKASTEAELVALSDSAGQGIHTRNFLVHQGYTVGPVTVYQDNLSCLATNS